MYYLQSRYYDPDLCRFISADDFAYINTDTPMSVNAYAYCINNPILHFDPTGTDYVSPLGKQVAEIISAIFLTIDASQISDAFAALTANILGSKIENIFNWEDWYVPLADDFEDFMETSFYKFINFFDENFFFELFSKSLIDESIPKIKKNIIEIFFTYGNNKLSEILSNLFNGQVEIFGDDNFSTGLIVTFDDVGIYIEKVIAKFGSLIVGINAKIQISINNITNIPPPSTNNEFVFGYYAIYFLILGVVAVSSILSPAK